MGSDIRPLTEMIKNYEVFTPVVEFNDKQAVGRGALQTCTYYTTRASNIAGLHRDFYRFKLLQLHPSFENE